MELLRDRRAAFEELGVQPVGISRDSPWTHIAWTQGLGPTFGLLSARNAGAVDPDFGLLSGWNAEAVYAFGIGIEFRGFKDVAARSAFLVDAEGVIRNA